MPPPPSVRVPAAAGPPTTPPPASSGATSEVRRGPPQLSTAQSPRGNPPPTAAGATAAPAGMAARPFPPAPTGPTAGSVATTGAPPTAPPPSQSQSQPSPPRSSSTVPPLSLPASEARGPPALTIVGSNAFGPDSLAASVVLDSPLSPTAKAQRHGDRLSASMRRQSSRNLLEAPATPRTRWSPNASTTKSSATHSPAAAPQPNPAPPPANTTRENAPANIRGGTLPPQPNPPVPASAAMGKPPTAPYQSQPSPQNQSSPPLAAATSGVQHQRQEKVQTAAVPNETAHTPQPQRVPPPATPATASVESPIAPQSAGASPAPALVRVHTTRAEGSTRTFAAHTGSSSPRLLSAERATSPFGGSGLFPSYASGYERGLPQGPLPLACSPAATAAFAVRRVRRTPTLFEARTLPSGASTYVYPPASMPYAHVQAPPVLAGASVMSAVPVSLSSPHRAPILCSTRVQSPYNR